MKLTKEQTNRLMSDEFKPEKTYTINGKNYTEFDINKRCADILNIAWHSRPLRYTRGWACSDRYNELGQNGNAVDLPDYCNNPSDAWTIIEKCWDELNTLTRERLESPRGVILTKWQHLMQKHNCSPLVAACICFIEINEEK